MIKDDAKALWEKTRANGRAWDACVGPHELEDLTPGKMFGKRYRCRLCGGECDSVAKLFYEQGLAHGRGEATT